MVAFVVSFHTDVSNLTHTQGALTRYETSHDPLQLLKTSRKKREEGCGKDPGDRKEGWGIN